MSVEVGSVYRSTLAVTNSVGALIDPATQTLTVTLPDQTTVTPGNTRDSLGTFHADYTIIQEGAHKFVWVTTGPVTSRTDYVNANAFRSIVGIDEVRAYISYTTTDKDSILRAIMASATDLAEGIAGSCVQRRYVNEIVSGYSAQVLRLPHAPLPTASAVETITSVWPGGPSWVTADVIAYPASGTVEAKSMIPFWYGPWQVTYTAGRLVIPERIQLAVKEIVYDMWALQRPFGVDSYELGPDETSRYEAALAQYDIPPHAKSLLEKEAQPGFA